MVPYVDLLIGVVPIINLEWIQKIHRDSSERAILLKMSLKPSRRGWTTT